MWVVKPVMNTATPSEERAEQHDDLAAVAIGQDAEDDRPRQLRRVEPAGQERDRTRAGSSVLVMSSTRKTSMPPVMAVLTRSTKVATSMEVMERFTVRSLAAAVAGRRHRGRGARVRLRRQVRTRGVARARSVGGAAEPIYTRVRRWLAALTSPLPPVRHGQSGKLGPTRRAPCHRTSDRTTPTRARARWNAPHRWLECCRPTESWPRRSARRQSDCLRRSDGGSGSARRRAVPGCSIRPDMPATPGPSTPCATPARGLTSADTRRRAITCPTSAGKRHRRPADDEVARSASGPGLAPWPRGSHHPCYVPIGRCEDAITNRARRFSARRDGLRTLPCCTVTEGS